MAKLPPGQWHHPRARDEIGSGSHASATARASCASPDSPAESPSTLRNQSDRSFWRSNSAVFPARSADESLEKGGYLQALHSAPSFAVLDAQPPFTETTRSWYSRARRATAPMRFVRLRARRAGFPFVVAWSNITTFPRQRPNSSWTIDGRLAISASSTRAGPTGRRRPCSQFLSVPSRTPMLRARSGWDIPVLPRIATTSGADTSIRCALNPARSPFTYA